MSNLLVSLNENILKVSFYGIQGFKTKTLELSKDIVNDSTILDSKTFTQAVVQAVQELSPSKDAKLNFLVEPENIILKFILVNKRDGDLEEQIINEIKTKLKDVNLDELYFSYIKIAPFVYQFMGIKKDVIDKYLEISNLSNIPVQSVVSWVMLLPKYENPGASSIFIVRNTAFASEETQTLAGDLERGKQIIALSELNGIYFVGEYTKETTSNELQTLVHDLSIYRREVPINEIYTLGYEHFDLGAQYKITPIQIPGQEAENSKGYELHLLFNEVVNTNPSLISTQLNLLNLLPLPVVDNKSKSLVAIGGVVAAVLLVGGGFLLFTHLKKPETKQVATNNPPVVLSDSVNPTKAPESTESSPSVAKLSKGDLSIRIENGAGIPGIAGKLKEKLDGLGYNVLEIGNASSTDHPTTLLKFKASKAKYEPLLKADMSDHTITVTEDLPETANYDVLITIGAK